jgi:hypothetical protein
VQLGLFALVKIYILLDGDLFRLRNFPTTSTVAVPDPKNQLLAVISYKLDVGHHARDHHGSDDGSADCEVPDATEVFELVSDWDEAQDGVVEVGVSEEKKNTSVNELRGEDEGDHELQGQALVMIANSLDQVHVDVGDDSIEDADS